MDQNLGFNQPLFAQLAPFAFLAALLIIWFVIHQQKKWIEDFGDPETLRRFSRFSSKGKKVRISLYFALSLSFVSLAFADPWASGESQTNVYGLNAILVCDASRSMGAEDTSGGAPRHKLVSRAFSEVLKAYQGLFGVIYFTDKSQSYGPSSRKEDLLLLAETVCQPSAARGSGSDLSEGLKAALKMAKAAPEPIKVVILLSDGGDPLRFDKELLLVEAFKDAGVRIISGGVGGTQYVPIPIRDPKTGQLINYYDSGEALTRLEDSDLRYLARETGGVYQKVEKGTELVEILRPLSSGIKTRMEVSKISVVWMPLSALLLVLLMWFLDKRFMR